jgi:outer membrane protein TolC
MPRAVLRLHILVLSMAIAGFSQATPPAASATLTLQDALQRAKKNSVQFLSAMTDAKIAHEDAVQARAAVLPSVTYDNTYLYTQGNGTPVPRFIANNAVHEYLSQGNAHEAINLGPGAIAEIRHARASEALARAKAEVATRGLLVTVVQNYYGLIAAQQKLANFQSAASEAQNFLELSRKLEGGGEVAHSDTIKAQLQANDRSRDALEAQLAADKAKLALAVLVFPNIEQDFTVVDDLNAAPVLPSLADTEAASGQNNPDLRAALAAVDAAKSDINVARGAHFPTLTLDYFYGIDAAQFASRAPDGLHNLGYSAAATLNIPIWNWGAVESKVKQAEYRQQQAKVELSAAQRQLVANLRSFYAEAQFAQRELETLKASADLAAESLRLTTLRYQAGEATALEVVDAQNTLVTDRSLLADGAVRYRTALANLQTLTGTF